MRALEEALARGDWDGVDAILDASFVRCLAGDPKLVDEVFQSAPAAWFTAHPRQAMSRAIAEATRRPGMVVRADAVADFRTWVGDQQAPAPRDVLFVQLADLHEAVAHGCYRDASALVDAILGTVRNAPRRSHGFSDIVPMVLVRCGRAKLLAADPAGAAECFADAIRWATLSQEHPLARFAKEHLALVLALEERFADAEPLLDDSPLPRSRPGTLQHVDEPAGLLAGALVKTAALDAASAAATLAQLDHTITNGEFGWIAAHAQARAASTGGARWELIHRINTLLITGSTRTGPETIAGAVLRVDLAGLYQSVGDLPAAESVLATPGLLQRPGTLAIPLARQALMRGHPEQAIAILRQNTQTPSDATPPRYLPTGVVLSATAELAASGDVAEATLDLAAATVNHHRAYGALAHASPGLHERLAPLIDRPATMLPAPWSYRERVRLTPREREVLAALGTYSSINEIAAVLHVSPNTAKTHVQTLYRKLGAHTRDEALRLGPS